MLVNGQHWDDISNGGGKRKAPDPLLGEVLQRRENAAESSGGRCKVGRITLG